VELIAVSRLPTKWGLFRAHCYQSKLDGTEHIAVVKVMQSPVPPLTLILDRKCKLCLDFQLWSRLILILTGQCLRRRAISATVKTSW
jgi:hypothetical protein